jgi:HK97 gp10 family phage protein
VSDDNPDGDIQSYLDGLSFKVKKKLAQTIKEQADMLADAIKDAAPVKSGALRNSVQVRRGRNTLDLTVTAGGDATTKELRTGSGVDYDYALAAEFGNSKEAAEPFFYSTYREHADEIRQVIDAAVDEAINS